MPEIVKKFKPGNAISRIRSIRSSAALPPAFILLTWLIFASPYLFRGLVPFPSKYLVTFFAPWNATYAMPVKNNAMPDIISQIYPWKRLTVDTWKEGSIPLWNPYSFAGTVHAANYQSAAFTPFNLLFLVLPFIDAWSILVLLQPLLSGLFTYAYARKTGISGLGSVLSGMAFMFSGFIVTWMAYGTLAYAALYLPLLLYFMERKTEKWRWAPVCIAGTVFLSFASGHFQISLYVFGAGLLYGTFISLKGTKMDLSKMSGIMGAMILGLGLSAIQLLPAYSAYLSSSRQASFIRSEIIPWRYIVTLFAPDFYGNPVTRNDWFGHYAEWNAYAGVVPLILAVFAVLAARNARRMYFVVIAVISILFAYRSPLTEALYVLRIPVLSTSAASRVIMLFSFSVSILSGMGLDRLGDILRKAGRKRILIFMGSLFILISLLWLFAVMPGPLPPEAVAIAKRNLILPVVMIAAFGILAVYYRTGKPGASFVPFILVLLTAADLLRFSAKWMPFDPREFVYPETRLISFLKAHSDSNRVFANFGNEVGGTFGIQLIEGYDAMYAGRYGQFMNVVSRGVPGEGARSVVAFDKHGRYALQALELLGVRYIVHRLSDGKNIWAFPVWEHTDVLRSVYKDEAFEVFEFEGAYPRAFLASSYIVKGDPVDIADELFSDVNRRDTLILEDRPVQAPAPGEGYAEIARYAANEVIVKTDSGSPKLLFLSDAYDPGWKAFVDGEEAPVYRADFAFRAVPVPAGQHSVKFAYMPESFRKGLVAAGISLAVLLYWSVFWRKA